MLSKIGLGLSVVAALISATGSILSAFGREQKYDEKMDKSINDYRSKYDNDTNE